MQERLLSETGFLHIDYYLFTIGNNIIVRGNMRSPFPKMVWDNSLSTGHIETDLQHQILFDIINDLIDAIETNEAEEQFYTILDRLQQYAEWHFHQEEKCMRDYRCPSAEINKIAHVMFLKKIAEFREKSSEGATTDIASQLYNELSSWLVHHIKKIDCALKECLNDYGFNNTPDPD